MRMRQAVSLCLVIAPLVAIISCLGPDDSLNSPQKPITTLESIRSQGVGGVGCFSLADCQPYEVCIANATIGCVQNHCIATFYLGGTQDLTCLEKVFLGQNPGSPNPPNPVPTSTPTATTTTSPPAPTPPNPPSCGKAPAPVEQLHPVTGAADRSYCHFLTLKPGDAHFGTLWIQVVADTPGSTIHIQSASLYGVRSDGTIEALTGTAAGKLAINWGGTYKRSPWFEDDDHVSFQAEGLTDFYIPTGDTLLHLGNNGVDVSGYSEIIAAVEAQTTGDARFQVGVDYRKSVSVYYPKGFGEGGVSDWLSCQTGAILSSSPPAFDQGNCQYKPVATPPVQNPPEPNPSTFPGSGPIVIQLAPWVQSSCNEVMIRAFTGSKEVKDSTTGFLPFSLNGGGYLWWNLYCDGAPWGYRWGFDGSSIRHVSDVGGISVQMNGVEVSTKVRICQNAPGSSSKTTHMANLGLDSVTYDDCP